MAIPDEVRLLLEGAGFAGSAAVVLYKLGRLGERFDNHTADLQETKVDIKDVKGDMSQMKDAMQTLAVQKEAIANLRDMMNIHTKSVNETFSRVFANLDRLQTK